MIKNNCRKSNEARKNQGNEVRLKLGKKSNEARLKLGKKLNEARLKLRKK